MRLTTCFVPTLKEVPADAVIPSHRLMLRAGLIRALSAGVYSFLPLGYRALKKVMRIIREEMDAIGGQEFHLPALNPVELWDETGRTQAFGDTMFHLKNRPYVLAPTHEEVIASIAKSSVKSYKDMPQIWYQIQTKFRNEPRPKSGVIRSRQFTMKDSYTLDATWEGLDHGYDLHAQAYRNIFRRCGLNFFVVGASSGAMGGSASQEFMIESEAGEDICAINEESGYAANLEIASSALPPVGRLVENPPAEKFPTPGARTIDDLIERFGIPEERCAKSLVYIVDSKPYLIFMCGNDQLNESKLQAAIGAQEFRPAHDEELLALTGADSGSIGPINLKTPVTQIADLRLEGANGLVSGANENGFHFRNIDFERDAAISGFYDLRTISEGEPDPVGGKPLRIVKAIELGHIFKLGTKYADALKATFLDENGEEKPIIMGSYGIGVERIIACHIEQRHDENGIAWHPSIAPFQVHLIGVKMPSPEVRDACDEIYDQLRDGGFEVLYDDRSDVTPGFKFKDADLLGMPIQIVIGEKNLKDGKIEMKLRGTGERTLLPRADLLATVRTTLETLNAA